MLYAFLLSALLSSNGGKPPKEFAKPQTKCYFKYYWYGHQSNFSDAGGVVRMNCSADHSQVCYTAFVLTHWGFPGAIECCKTSYTTEEMHAMEANNQIEGIQEIGNDSLPIGSMREVLNLEEQTNSNGETEITIRLR